MERFIGAWRLLVFEELGSDGHIAYPYGSDAVGLLIYDSSGRMSVQIMRRDRAAALLDESLPGTVAKKKSEDFTSFFGTYEVDEANGVIIHRVEGHVLAESVGKVLRRGFSFSGNALSLTPAPNRRVIWERIAAHECQEKTIITPEEYPIDSSPG